MKGSKKDNAKQSVKAATDVARQAFGTRRQHPSWVEKDDRRFLNPLGYAPTPNGTHRPSSGKPKTNRKGKKSNG